MEKTLCIQLGKRIRELRIAKCIKQGELAEKLEMEPSNLTRIENGKQHPNDRNIVKLAEIFNVEISELYNFGHMKSFSELINLITEEMQTMSPKEIQCLYKAMQNIKSMR